jgi:hypothetical protein
VFLLRLELMLNMRFGQQNRRKSPGTTLPTLKSTPIPLPKSKRSAAEELASIVEEQVIMSK